MIILGIESTCDETAASIVKDGSVILSNVIASQDDIHSQYGGVFPELAARAHVDIIMPVINDALIIAGVTPDDIDAIAVANEPGLIGSILVGLNTAKTLSMAWNKPFIGINHIEAHLYAAMMSNNSYMFPSLGVVISGGHTLLLKINDIGNYEKIGTTIDDAVGEAFDKVASILKLPYPGGPHVEKLAKDGISSYYPLIKPSKMKDKPFHFSFSGLKTKVLYTAKGQGANKNSPLIISESEKAHLAAAFQEAAFDDIIDKAALAADSIQGCKGVYFGGGVTNNKRIKEKIEQFKIEQLKIENKNIEIPVFWPSKKLSLDNAAMIAGLAFHKVKNKSEKEKLDLVANAKVFSGI
jgi:N6-L-threonylcarbamoyladenine synthase